MGAHRMSRRMALLFAIMTPYAATRNPCCDLERSWNAANPAARIVLVPNSAIADSRALAMFKPDWGVGQRERGRNHDRGADLETLTRNQNHPLRG
jgi:hypothetical protein